MNLAVMNRLGSGTASISMGPRRPFSPRRVCGMTEDFLETGRKVLVPAFFLFCCFSGWPLPDARAASSVHRISLQVGGSSCGVQQSVLSKALLALPGVMAVDWSLLPDQALIDLDVRLISEQDLVTAAARAAGPSCDVRPMASCISPMSAGSTVTRPSIELAGSAGSLQ